MDKNENLSFRWIFRIIEKGISETLRMSDFSKLDTDESDYSSGTGQSSYLKKNLREHWEKRKNHRYGLMSAIFHTFKFPILFCLVVRILDRCFLMAVERLLLGEVIQAVRICKTGSCSNAWIIIGFVMVTTLRCVLHRVFYFINKALCKKVRIAVTSLFYSKLLRLSLNSLQKIRTGDLVSLVCSGGMAIEMSFFIPSIITGPLQILAQFYVLWTNFQGASGSGLGVLILLGVWQSYLGKLGTYYRTKIAIASASRLRLVTQILSGIKTIKLRTLENFFYNKVATERRKGCNELGNSNILEALRYITASCSPILAMIITVSCYVLFGNEKSPEQIVVASTIFYHLRATIFVDIPTGLKQLGSLENVVCRFQEILLLEEVNSRVQTDFAKGNISITNLVLKSDCNKLTLENSIIRNGNLDVAYGEFLQIVGKTGSGKTALLKAILGELALDSGEIKVGGKISYASQDPWIFPGTIRHNITFYSKFDTTRYRKIIEACALIDDLNTMQFGDLTVVAEGGGDLSGGQKSRIALARAMYADVEIYILDDVLSNIDAHVGAHVFNHCINAFLKDKTVILCSGNKVSNEHHNGTFDKFEKQIQRLNGNANNLAPISGRTDYQRRILKNSYLGIGKNEIENLEAEKISSSSSTVEVYWQYLAIGSGYTHCFLYCVFTICFMTLYHQMEFWLQQSFKNFSTELNVNYDHIGFALGVICLILVAAGQQIFLLKIIKNGREYFHNRMLSSVLAAPLTYFTKTPRGEILEQFSSNLSVIDEIFAFKLHDAIHIFLMYLAGYSILVYRVGATATAPLVGLFTVGFYVQKFNIKLCQQLTVLSQKAKIPIVSGITSSINGITTIRALRKCKEVEQHYDQCLDTRFWIDLAHLGVDDLATLVIDLTTIGLLNAAVIAAVFFHTYGIEAALSPLLSFGATVGFAFSLGVVLVSNGKCAEGILNVHQVQPESYSFVKEQETDLTQWPWKGKIVFSDVSAEYEPGISVLKNLNFTIQPGETVAIIGKTGCGKSTLTSTLVRLIEICTGEILIDGINICDVPLKQLRQKVFVVPQDPFVFHGSLRIFLDPVGEFSDDEIWEALHTVQLDNMFSTFENGLQTEIGEMQSVLSSGQLQLLNLAKAVLVKPRILVLDESMAYMDENTSQIVSRNIRSVLPNTTIVTVLHRLTFIHTFDKVMIMDNGEVTDYGSPESIASLSLPDDNSKDVIDVK